MTPPTMAPVLLLLFVALVLASEGDVVGAVLVELDEDVDVEVDELEADADKVVDELELTPVVEDVEEVLLGVLVGVTR
jgi:hypothetical protein